jgi:hypothetical protein
MTGYLRLLLFSCALVLSFRTARAQAPLTDTAASRLAVWNTIVVYHRFMGTESRLANGREHIGFLPMNGHPYFQEETAQIGSIVFEDAWYRDVPLLYDIVRDEIVAPTPTGDMVSLADNKVSEFYLLGHHFIKASTGYYDLLCSGRIILEAKRIKRVVESIEGLQVVRNIEYADHYYAVRDGVRYSIGNLRSLLALMKDKKKEVNQDLRRKKIRYRKQHEKALVEAVTYYNQSFPQ